MLTAKPRMPYSELGFTEQLCYNYGVSASSNRKEPRGHLSVMPVLVLRGRHGSCKNTWERRIGYWYLLEEKRLYEGLFTKILHPCSGTDGCLLRGSLIRLL